VVGYLNAYKNTNKKIPIPYEILYFYIHPDFQHQGIGQKLFQHFKQTIKNKPFYLYMLKGNIQAQKFYEKMGGVQQSQNMDIGSKVYNFTIHEVCWIFNPKE